MDQIEKALLDNFGWDHFKPGQRRVIQAVIEGKDSIAVFPTAGGKSLCYQLPSMICSGLVVVVSPLIALMEDQVKQLRNKKITAICLHSALDECSKNKAIELLQDPKKNLRMLYLSPERLGNRFIQDFLSKKAKKKELIALAVDEAHCISGWGHDFRPDYRKLGRLRDLCPDVPIIALSATAPPKVRADIIRLLRMRNPVVQVCSSRRNNLQYFIKRRSKDPLCQILEELKHSRGASLIYVRTRKAVHSWTELLQKSGIPAIPYHAGLEHKVRKAALTEFLCQPKPVLVATIAFGMGIDRGDVGLVIHLNLPPNPERYLQESGRAGRDGLPARCLILFSPGDRIRLSWAIRSAGITTNKAMSQSEMLCRNELMQEQIRLMEEIAEGERCIEQALLLAIGEIASPCGQCDRCRKSSSLKNCSGKALILLRQIKINEGINISRLIQTLDYKKEVTSNSWGWLARRLIKEDLVGESIDGSQKLYLKKNGIRYLRDPWPLHYEQRA